MNIETMYAQYQEQGYVLIPDALGPDEVRELQATTDRIAAQAAGLTEENALFDFEAAHTPEAPMVQRLKKPHRVDPLYFALAKHPAVFPLVQRICGENMRLSHSKINMKAAREGSPLEWHQDWAFAPHTNMSTCVASVMIDERTAPCRCCPAATRGRCSSTTTPSWASSARWTSSRRRWTSAVPRRSSARPARCRSTTR